MAPPVLIGSQPFWKVFVRGMIHCTSVGPTEITDLQKNYLEHIHFPQHQSHVPGCISCRSRHALKPQLMIFMLRLVSL